MRTISTSLFQSLDGVLEADNDWQFPYLDDETFDALTADWDRSDAVLLGRHSFEGFIDVRESNPDSPVVGFLDSVQRFVVAGAGYRPRWEDTNVISGNVVAQVRELKQRDGANILVIGSPTLLRALLAADLVEAFAVVVLPILVGPGPRLMTDDTTPADRVPLRVAKSRTLDSGALHVVYTKRDPA